MTDDLVNQLRSLINDDDTEMLAWDAANRIEKLEAALREIAQAVGDPAAYWLARAALGEKKDAD
jgi:hypothetical protein